MAHLRSAAPCTPQVLVECFHLLCYSMRCATATGSPQCGHGPPGPTRRRACPLRREAVYQRHGFGAPAAAHGYQGDGPSPGPGGHQGWLRWSWLSWSWTITLARYRGTMPEQVLYFGQEYHTG